MKATLIIILLLASQLGATNPETPKKGHRGFILCHIQNDKVSLYINSIYTDAEIVANESGLPLGLLLSMGCLESGFGTSNIAKNKCNHLGMKRNGKYIDYPNQLACFRHWARTLTGKRYKQIPLTSLNLWLYELDYNCYHFGGALYSKKIRSIYYKYGLDILPLN